MIKEREPVLERISVTFQVLLTLISFFIVLWLSGLFYEITSNINNDFILFAMIISVIWYILLEFFEMGKMSRIQRYRHIIKQYAMLVSLGAFVLILIAEVFRFEFVTSLIILKFALLNFIVLTWQKNKFTVGNEIFSSKGV